MDILNCNWIWFKLKMEIYLPTITYNEYAPESTHWSVFH